MSSTSRTLVMDSSQGTGVIAIAISFSRKSSDSVYWNYLTSKTRPKNTCAFAIERSRGVYLYRRFSRKNSLYVFAQCGRAQNGAS